MEQHIMAGATFGLLRSDDAGATWHWYCEKTVGYGGTYDPDYVYTASGAVFGTTFDGLKVMRDGCSFVATPPGMTFVSRVEDGPDGALYFSASDPNDTKIYKSTDDGVTFPTSAMPGIAGDWWQTIMVAPSNATRVYLSGYRLPMKCTGNTSNPGAPCTSNADCPAPLQLYPPKAIDVATATPPSIKTPLLGTCEPQKEFLLFKSVNGGTSYGPIDITDITPTSPNSTIDIDGVDPTDEDILYARVTFETATAGDSIWKSLDGGVNWTKILSKSSNIGGLSFLVRNDGSCVAGTRDIGAWKSAYVTDAGCGATWVDLPTAPHIGCLYKNPANDDVWACTQNTASPQLGITSDGFGLMKSADLASWTGMLRFEDIKGPVPCGAETVQESQCVQKPPDMQSQWCCLITQLGITSTAVDCTGELQCFGAQPEPAVDGGTVVTPEPGCLGCGAGAEPTTLVTLLVAGGLLFRRRRRSPKES
jgi:MYXO-CTERM domain-containing protein